MKRKQLTPIALIFVLAIVLLIFYKPKTKYHTLHGETQGTTYTIKFEYYNRIDLHSKITQLLHKFDLSLSTYDSNSIISKVNRNEPHVKLDKNFKKVFNKANEIYHLSGGAFDITVAPIVNAWGFGSGQSTKVDSLVIDSLLQLVGMDKISLEGGVVVKQNPNITLDVNAIAQGFSVDVVADFLERKGVENYMVEIGGELKTKGVNEKGNIWKIGVDKPVENSYIPGENLQAVIQVKDMSLATSGNYRKFYEKDGVKYVHSINPKTGYPVMSKLLSATVMTRDCMTADAFATSFMVMGLEKSIMFLSDQNDIQAYFVYSDDEGNYKTFMTPGMKDALVREMD
ncbi:MAG: FAD:protein FMN transferase [Bacteroidales bacterium]|nr:FAD:protein FMN transferase [Bacteroidales bacterium]MBN2818484.1 FAD:protein FMN transferase [Bacteroidales bacterium]